MNWKNLTAFADTTLIPTKETFANNALILKDVKSRYIDLVNKRRHETIRVHGTNTPFLGIWGKDSVPFVCVEPWYGVGDDLVTDQRLEGKVGVQVLGEGGTFRFAFGVEIL